MAAPPADILSPVAPGMVTLARQARGLSQTELAALLNITQGRLSKIESGLLPVSDDLLTVMVRQLHFPPGFFQQTGRTLGVGVAELFHRKRQNVSAKVLDKIHAVIEIRSVHHVKALLRSSEIECKIPQFDVDAYGGQADDIARMLRATWTLPKGPIPNLTRVIEDAGGVVIPFDFETHLIDAISRWVPGLPPLFFVNRMVPTDRLRWSLAHELGHMVMHALPTPEIEQQADAFAAEFLVPAREARSDLANVTLPSLANLKRYWKVSMQALLRRAENIGTITRNQARYLWSQMARAGYRTREPIELDPTIERPDLLRELVDIHRKELGYSIADLAEMLTIYEDELRAWYMADDPAPHLRVVIGQ